MSFSTTWLSWLSHCIYYFVNKERKGIDRPKVYIVFCLVIFFFNHSKNNAVLGSRTALFSRTCRLRSHCQGLQEVFSSTPLLLVYATLFITNSSKCLWIFKFQNVCSVSQRLNVSCRTVCQTVQPSSALWTSTGAKQLFGTSEYLGAKT